MPASAGIVASLSPVKQPTGGLINEHYCTIGRGGSASSAHNNNKEHFYSAESVLFDAIGMERFRTALYMLSEMNMSPLVLD